MKINYVQREKRIVEVNAILATFAPSIHIYDAFDMRRSVILRMCWDVRKPEGVKYDFPADLRSDGSWPRYGWSSRPTGGTGIQALGQLIRYIRDLTRLPVLTWEYWCKKIGLGNAETLRLIGESEYGDPVKTCCVFCGSTEWKNDIDWYSFQGKVGPGCAWNTCQKKEKE